jgi:hypothetical protein
MPVTKARPSARSRIVAAGFDGRLRDVIVLALEGPGRVNQHVHAELAKLQRQARVGRVDAAGGVGSQPKLIRERGRSGGISGRRG